MEASLVDIANYRPARATSWDPVSRKERTNEERKKDKSTLILFNIVKVRLEAGESSSRLRQS